MSEQTDPRVEIGTAAAVERIQRRYPEGTLARVVADDIAKAVVESAIAALEAAGYTVARLEQVAWGKPINEGDWTWSVCPFPDFGGEGRLHPDHTTPLYRIAPASPAAPAEPRDDDEIEAEAFRAAGMESWAAAIKAEGSVAPTGTECASCGGTPCHVCGFPLDKPGAAYCSVGHGPAAPTGTECARCGTMGTTDRGWFHCPVCDPDCAPSGAAPTTAEGES